MIGSFWNLCRTCPSMPVDKLHSEYRSTYRWHEYTGPRQEVVRRGPQSAPPPPPAPAAPTNAPAATRPRMEPALPRRKKHPELAYRTHEFLALTEDKPVIGGSDDSLETAAKLERARVLGGDLGGGGGGGGAFSAAMNRISTEYRLQFAWPRGNSSLMGAGAGRMLRPGVAAAVTAVTAAAKVVTSDGPPRKSLSMGAIKPGNTSGVGFISVHKKRCADCDRGDEGASELEPLVNDSIQQNSSCMVDGEDLHGEEKIQDEHLSKEDKPRRRREYKTEYKKKFRPFSQYDYVEDIPQGDSWYREVLELRKKAGEYKHRGWGTEFVPQHIAELYTKQMTLWEQVSRRSSLSALSLASTTPRCISKEEKDKENNKKSSPSKVFVAKSDLSRGQDNDKKKGDKSESRSRKEFLIRHHLDRTTGTTARSQSLGPAASYENRSPKRQPRAIDSTKTSSAGITPKSTPGTATNGSAAPNERRPRSNLDFQKKRKSYIHKTDDGSPVPAPVPVPVARPSEENVGVSENNKTKEEDSPAVHSFADPIHEPVVKSPPEPTRVKSPEQLLMRSPEPVNWTVPLDTGKTFTVTQNVREGESCVNRPHSEAKAWTPPAIPPPPAPQSAPPQLTDDGNIFKQIAEENQAEPSLPGRIAEFTHQPETVNPEPSIAVASCPGTRIAGTTLHCLDAPIEESAGLTPVPSTSSPYRVLEAPDLDMASTSSGKSIASDVLEMARSRFDKLFGKANTSSADEDENV